MGCERRECRISSAPSLHDESLVGGCERAFLVLHGLPRNAWPIVRDASLVRIAAVTIEASSGADRQ